MLAAFHRLFKVGWLAAYGVASNAGYIGVQPRLKLKEVQVPPLTAKPVMNALIGRIAVRARQAAGIADEVEVDAPTRRVKLDILAAPRRLQAQCAGKQRFDTNSHLGRLCAFN